MKPVLAISKEEFQLGLQERIKLGEAILIEFSRLEWSKVGALEALKKRFRMWDSYNKDWLEQVFTPSPNKYSKQYGNASGDNVDKWDLITQGESSSSPRFRFQFFEGDVLPKIEYLEDLLGRIDLLSYSRIDAPVTTPSLAHLHPLIHRVAGRLFEGAHYPQAILAACTALDKYVQQRAGQPAELIGTALMNKVFSPASPVLRLSEDQSERQGYLFLFAGSVQALRNHYAHNLSELNDPNRALEWLSFLSALLHTLGALGPPSEPAAP